MLRKSHIVVSETVIISTTLYSLEQVQHQPLGLGALGIAVPMIVGGYIGAQMPDIDHPKTRINKIMGPIGDLFVKLGHRGITHSLLMLALIFYPIYTYNKEHFGKIFTTEVLSNLHPDTSTMLFVLYFGFALGYLLHVIEDSFSKQGILWFAPITHWQKSSHGTNYKRRIIPKFIYYTTGSKTENVIRYLFYPFLIFNLAALLGELL